jgi:diaminopimelate dehydrogenase
MTIRIGILGYGNLGKGVENSISQNPDMELVAVFTRRAPDSLKIASQNVPVISIDNIIDWKDKIDVLI